jgi:hypothetical protein
MEIKKFNHTAFAKQNTFSCQAIPLTSMEIKENSIMQHLQNREVPTPGKDTKFQWPSWIGVSQ